MPSLLSITFTTGSDRPIALRKLQTIVDGAVAPRIDIIAADNSGIAEASFPDDVASEQVLACFKAAVNMAGITDSGYVSKTPVLTGNVLSGSLSREYSV